jgi:phosphoglycolate phosphatase
MTDAIIFDIDGTIWDSTEVVEKAWNLAAKKAGILDKHITAAELKALFGRPMEEIIDILFADETEEKKAELGPLCFEYEHAFLKKEPGKIYPGVEDMLKLLHGYYRLFIVSNCQAGYIETVLHATGFGPFFEDYACPGDTGLLKAENIRLIMERNGLKSAIYVGDTQMDAEACKKAGIPIIYAAYGFGKAEQPEYTIETPSELAFLMQKIDNRVL